jgi:hypothetical protein
MADFEQQRIELQAALATARPHYSWLVRFDQGESDADRMLFVACRNDAGKTWQLSLPAERLETDDVAIVADEILEGMDDELSG